MERVLHIVGNMNMGGQETFIMNVYENIDRRKVQFDFIVHSKEEGYYDKRIEELGGRIYRIFPISKHPIKSIKQLIDIIKKNKYTILHRHTSSSVVAIEILIARILKVKKIIVHSHNNSSKHKIINKIFRPILNLCANYKFACSEDAAKWLFGKKHYKEVKIIYNGINLQNFLYNEEIRKKIRTQFNIKDNIVIGHIGRFEYQKNHKFIINIFSELLKNNKKYELWLIGDGKLKEEIEDYIGSKKIKEHVKLFGIVDNVNELLQGMDIFIFPSIYEGLGISLIEAQISGLKSIVSEAIQEEAIITDNVYRIPLSKTDLWKKKIESIKQYCRHITINSKMNNFSINNVSKTLEKIYLEEQWKKK